MYTDFYKLNAKPFQISSDPAFIWLGEKHKEALATLRYGVIDNKGLMLLTGDVGTGKTTLINTLLESLSADVYYAFVPDPRLNLIDLLNYIAQAFHIDNDFTSKGSFLLQFGWFLEGVYKQNKKALLIIDEAQLLTQDLLEEIRLLSNIHRDGNHLLNIFFVGQNEFNEILHRPENRAVTQRITLNYQINPLTIGETAQYIRHRLKVAGASHSIFSTSAVKAISSYSEGIPRRINVICDHCLITGYISEKSTIDAAIVEGCIKDIAIPQPDKTSQSSKKDARGQTQIGDNVSSAKKWQRITLFVISVMMLAGIIATLISPYIRESGNIDSTVRSAVSSLPSKSDSAPSDQQQERGTLQPQAEPIPNSETPLEDSTEILPDNEETIQPSIPSIYQPSNVDKPDEGIKLETAEQTTAPTIPVKQAPKESDTETVDSQLPITKIEKIKIEENIEIRTKSDIQNQPNPVHPLPVPEGSALKPRDTPQEQPKIKDIDPALELGEVRAIVRFERNSNDFSTANLDTLISLGLAVKNYTSVSLNISGYTDSAGSEEYNNRLSLIRASMVKSYLLGLGISPDRMKVQGLGSQNPIADNTTEAGRRLNRRVEIDVVAP